PTYAERRESQLNITVVGTKDGIVMIESGATEIPEDKVVDAIEFAHVEIKKIVAAITDLASRAGKKKREVAKLEFDEKYFKELKSSIGNKLADALDTKKYPKIDSYA